MKKVAIVQSNYIPWRGYFDLIAFVDEFIIYDDMQYTKRDWRNRNRIKTSQGLQWITVPVQVKGRFHQKIRETLIDGTDWAKAHWRALEFNYSAAAHFAEIADWLAPIYLEEQHTNLSLLNRRLLNAICSYLGISTRLANSWDYELADGKTERLANLCQQAAATEYVSGPSARSYVDERVFDELSIRVTWFDYDGYRDYKQLWGLLLDIEEGDEVILPSYTFVSTANAFVLRGGVPVFVDIRPDTLNIDETRIVDAITPRTKAIVPVHYAGVACEMDAIMKIATHHNLAVVEDAAQGAMASYRGRALGSIGDLGALSFHETKNVISGEGGALLVNS